MWSCRYDTLINFLGRLDSFGDSDEDRASGC